MNGKNAPDAEVRMIASDGLYLTVEGVGYFAAFRDFPFLAKLPLSQIFQVEYCGHGHIRWEEADIDLHTDILAHPECFPVDMQSGGGISAAAARMGKIGGAVKSARKSSASRHNGAKGGRPRKKGKTVLA